MSSSESRIRNYRASARCTFAEWNEFRKNAKANGFKSIGAYIRWLNAAESSRHRTKSKLYQS